MWRNLIEGRKIGVLRPIRTEVAHIFFSIRALLLVVLKNYIAIFSFLVPPKIKKHATMVEV